MDPLLAIGRPHVRRDAVAVTAVRVATRHGRGMMDAALAPATGSTARWQCLGGGGGGD